MEKLFLASFIILFYVFVGYPLLLAVLQKVAGRPVRKRPIEPNVTVILAVHNERQRIEKRLQNLLSLDYPREKLQIIVSIDGATDGTETVVQRYEEYGVTVLQSKWHVGKAAAINRAMLSAAGDIVIFADARQAFDKAAVRQLAANFADASVGAASGELLLMDHETQREAANPVGLYWRYEKLIRSFESRVHSVVGATGAIYAIRRELFTPLPEETILDDVMIPLRIVLAGKRVVFDASATAADVVACCPRSEYRRKVRTLAGNYQLVALLPKILVPFRNPIAWQLWSHKIGRLAAPFAMIVLFLSNALLVNSRVYASLFALQSIWYSVALIGLVESHRPLAQDAILGEQRNRAA